jgi:CheY-like chemotaxis protein
MAGHRPFLEHVKIVIVGDRSDVRLLISRFLAGRGAEVFAAKNATDGLQFIRQIRPDVVLSDMNMPGSSGFEFLAAIRTLSRSEGGQVPVIAMTGLGYQKDVTLAAFKTSE